MTTSERQGDGGEEMARGRVDMIPAKRRALILERLRREGAAGIQELADAIGASPSTIRRDLEHLVKQGALERTHGGALLQSTERATFEPDAAIAAQLRCREKNAIAAAVADELQPGQSVIFDASTTVLAVARAVVTRHLPLTAVTNSLAIAQILAGAPNIHLVVPGGTVRQGSLTLVGRPGEDFLRSLHADIALLGTHAITGRTLTETSLEVATMKQAMIAAARRVIVLADSSKFTSPSFCTICDVSDVQEIVTDDGVDLAVLAELAGMNVAVRVIPVPRQPQDGPCD
ncbi:DeoR family transcriptional regulator of aga operon [Angulomicrobium tetraedrale]|uniref:DeoR family transcriptional regulator of aga operon n=1 Tax=Ancylobacter tetraedralis TaxID=217068 RepID=A0A839ZA69_9HYPH|nr:DeoR/GlpR family DNA-binding transcription regulator [Ancylobacter tetraedralis]MBB3771634.1 DeoR family transcriptional regulator of aga operon [Ancylobacter tetraedralis]